VAFGGMAFTLGLLRLSFPLSTLSYLKFDLAEIPPIIAVLMFGKAFWFSY
jgi:riboflavin transporter FmnP